MAFVPIMRNTLMQVVVCSFIYEGSKTKTKPLSALEGDVSEAEHGNKLATPASAPPSQNYSQQTRGIWQADLKSTHTGIDLMNG